MISNRVHKFFFFFFCKSIWITLFNKYSWILTPTFRSRSPTIFKAEILADGVKGVLVEDFKGIPTIDFMTLGKNVWNFIFLNMDQI